MFNVAKLRIINDGSIHISGILNEVNVHFKLSELQNNDEVKFDKYEKYQLNPYETGFLPRKKA